MNGGSEPPSSTRRRICFITVEFHGLFKNGGIGTANTALAVALAERGFDVTVAIANSDESGPRLGGRNFNKLKSHWAGYGITLDFVRAHPLFVGSFDEPRTASYCVYLYVQRGGFDVVLFNDNGGHGYYSLLAKHTGVFKNPPLFCVVAHGPTDWVHELNAQEYSRLLVLRSYMERRCAALADLLVSPSAYLADWMASRNWVPRSRTRIVQNLVGAPAAKIARSAGPQRQPVSEIVFFGRLETRKGLTLFCDSMDLLGSVLDLHTVRVTFLGKFGRIGALHSGIYVAERARRWRAELRVLANHDQTQALDYLTKPGVLAVIPSRAENSPCVVAECLELGLLFLASNTGGTPELVAPEDRDSCLFSPEPEVLAARLADALRSGHRRARLAVSPVATLDEWLRLLPPAARDATPVPAAPVPDAPAPEIRRPRISVCIVHSTTPGFHACLESLCRQTYPDMEIVIVVETSVGAAGLPIDPRVDTRVIDAPCTSVGAARNAAARHASGDYLLFVDDAVQFVMPHAVATLAAAALKTSADILTGVREWVGGEMTSKPPIREYDLPVGACTEMGAVENCFGEGMLLVSSACFGQSSGFSECGRDVLDWLFLSEASLRGATLELVPLPLFRVRDAPLDLRDAERTLENHRRILQCYAQAPMATLNRIAESALNVRRKNVLLMQRALREISEPAREIVSTLVALDPNDVEASRLFVKYCCERRMVDLALDFSLHNALPFLPEAVTAIKSANESAAFALMRRRRFTLRHAIELAPQVLPQAQPYYGLRKEDIRHLPSHALDHLAPTGDSWLKLAGACPPGTHALRVTAATEAGETMQLAALLCRSWVSPAVLNPELTVQDRTWWSGWSAVGERGRLRVVDVALQEPATELLDLYLLARLDRPPSPVTVTWQRITADVGVIGDITPSAVETQAVMTPLSREKLKNGRLLTDVSDIPFPVFVPGERTLLHPLANRLTLALLPEALEPGTSGVQCLVSVEHAQAHPIQFGLWARSASSRVATAAELNEAAHFSGWVLVDTPFVKNEVTFMLPTPASETMDLYIATQVAGFQDAHFCHAYWHAIHCLAG